MSDEEWNPEAQRDESSSEDDEETQLPPTPDEPKRRKRKRTQVATNLPPPPPSGMIPESLINHVLNNLQNGNESDVRETLLRLARVFREQSALLLQQAQRLDDMALEQESSNDGVIENVTSDSHSVKLYRENVEFFVGKSADMKIGCQEMLDSIEGRLVPWDQKIDKSTKKKATGKPQQLTAYSLFTRDNYDSTAKRLGTKKMGEVAKEISKVWRALPEDEKEVYVKRSKEMREKAVNKQPESEG